MLPHSWCTRPATQLLLLQTSTSVSRTCQDTTSTTPPRTCRVYIRVELDIDKSLGIGRHSSMLPRLGYARALGLEVCAPSVARVSTREQATWPGNPTLAYALMDTGVPAAPADRGLPMDPDTTTRDRVSCGMRARCPVHGMACQCTPPWCRDMLAYARSNTPATMDCLKCSRNRWYSPRMWRCL